MEVDVLADLGAERPRVDAHPRGPGQVGRAHLVGDPLGEPQPQVHLAAARVLAGSQVGATGAGRRPR